MEENWEVQESNQRDIEEVNDVQIQQNSLSLEIQQDRVNAL